jgi:APA family basic amino acid/polyamine antiporter
VPSPGSAPLRAIGTLSLTAISVNTIIGAGIFALPANVAQLLGAQGPLAYLIAGAAILLIALCFAEAGSRFESSGGPYLYAREAFGELVGFEVCWMFVLARLTAIAAVANTFSNYLGYLWPNLAQGAGRFLAITILLGTLAGIHLAGVRSGALVNNVFTISKLLPLFVFCVAGLFLLDVHPPSLSPLPPAASLQQASLLLLFALGGFENATIPSEEVIDPKKSLPKAVLGSVGLVVLLFLWIQMVATAALPQLAASATPLASAARSFLGPAGGLMLTAAAALSTAGSNHVNLFAGPRLLYALGRDGLLPSWFAWLHPRFRTPTVSIVLYALVAWVLAWSSAFAQLAALAAVSRLLIYIGTCAAVPVLRRRMSSSPSQFTLPGGAVIPILALGVCIWLLGGTSVDQAAIAAAALLAGALLYGLTRRRRARAAA